MRSSKIHGEFTVHLTHSERLSGMMVDEGEAGPHDAIGVTQMRNLVTHILKLRREHLVAIMARLPGWTKEMLDSIQEYHSVPRGKARKEKALWRLAIGGLGLEGEVLGVEIWGDVILGRSTESLEVDINLSRYNGLELGVSRCHAMIRPTASALFLIDLGSTNGTLCNFVPLERGKAHRLTEGDVILLGGLHFIVMGIFPVA
jgi:hypothetical protein